MMTMPEIERCLRQLRLSGVRDTLQTRVLQAQGANQPFLETFSLILQDELDRRQSRLIVSDVRVPLAKVWRGDCSLLINVFANRWRGVWRRQRRRITRCGRTTRAGARRSGTAGDRLRSL
ncbi:hypothetical protein ACVIJW_007133 [Bradyrhizobium barranii subsp. barranii]